jgi:hypothetical protein
LPPFLISSFRSLLYLEMKNRKLVDPWRYVYLSLSPSE